jgi:hypothetical protein
MVSSRYLPQATRTLSIAVLATAILSATAIYSMASNAQVVYADGDGDEGCTPGYWKQEQHFDSYPVGITPDTLLTDLLGFEIPGYETTTVLQALKLKGGGADALIRQGTAGMLNVLSPEVDYDFSEETTLRQFQDGLDPQLFDMWPDADDDLEERKDALDVANNAGCPLN